MVTASLMLACMHSDIQELVPSKSLPYDRASWQVACCAKVCHALNWLCKYQRAVVHDDCSDCRPVCLYQK